MHFLSGIKAATQSAKKKKKSHNISLNYMEALVCAGINSHTIFVRLKYIKKRDKLSFLRLLLLKFPFNAVLKESAAFLVDFFPRSVSQTGTERKTRDFLLDFFGNVLPEGQNQRVVDSQ